MTIALPRRGFGWWAACHASAVGNTGPASKPASRYPTGAAPGVAMSPSATNAADSAPMMTTGAGGV
jgi:hypothetical protein